ncbi:MAG: hypothetical protein K9G33_06365, partial [Sneathiella sp.]|nr:hypothetical protein [Sneathiella sp.]
MQALAKTAVGKRGTSPVSKNVIVIGIASIMEVVANRINSQPKNDIGRSSFISLIMSLVIFKPSAKVFS